MTSEVSITFVIADTGPLISLAVADRLDLLQSFGTPVFVTDAVVCECLRMSSKPGVDRLRDWFRDHSNEVKIVETPMGEAYRKAAKLEDDGFDNPTKNFGEWASSWVMENVSALLPQLKLNPGRHFGLILSEDNDYLYGRPPHHKVPANAHFLSTQAFFVALERMGFIPSARDLRKTVQNNGRPQFAKSLADNPFKGNGVRTNYQSNLERVRINEERAERARQRSAAREDDADGGYKPRGP